MRRRAITIASMGIAESQSPYLTMEALEDNFSAALSQNTIEYSLYEPGNWVSLPADTSTPSIAIGDKIYFRGTGLTISGGIGNFTTTGKFNLSGNCFSLIYGDDIDYENAVPAYCFKYLFRKSKVVDASKLLLPCEILSRSCYDSMFTICVNLIKGPNLPSTTLAQDCYNTMYWGCESLIVASELPATKVVNGCYLSMYRGCISLETAPELPALVPDINCYTQIFDGCSNLSYIKCLATVNNGMSNWVRGVAASGTFVKKSGSPIVGPTGWEVVEI